MKLKLLLTSILAALFVFACSPESVPSDSGGNTTEQPSEGGSGSGSEEGGSGSEEGGSGSEEKPVPVVEIEEAGHISSDAARLYGGYSKASSTPTEKGFEWGTSPEELDGTVQSESVISGASGSFFADLSELQPDTEYFYRAYVKIDENGSSETYYSSVMSFRTEEASGGEEPGGSDKPGGDEPGNDFKQKDLPYLGCYEVPAVNLSEKTLISGKELSGNTNWYKYNTTNPDQKIVIHTYKSNSGKVARTYIILFDKTKKAPLWDCSAFNNDYWQRNNVGRKGSWKCDPALDDSWQNTGVSGYSKGHLTASNDRQDNKEANYQTFYYSNQAPQYQTGFNDGVWNNLENKIQAASPTGRDTIYVVNGLLYEGAEKLSDGVPIPSHFYKCIMYCSFGSDGKMTAAKGTAFIYTNERQSGSYNDSKFVTTIDAIEERTGFDFFANVPEELQNNAESGKSKYSL